MVQDKLQPIMDYVTDTAADPTSPEFWTGFFILLWILISWLYSNTAGGIYLVGAIKRWWTNRDMSPVASAAINVLNSDSVKLNSDHILASGKFVIALGHYTKRPIGSVRDGATKVNDIVGEVWQKPAIYLAERELGKDISRFERKLILNAAAEARQRILAQRILDGAFPMEGMLDVEGKTYRSAKMEKMSY